MKRNALNIYCPLLLIFIFSASFSCQKKKGGDGNTPPVVSPGGPLISEVQCYLTNPDQSSLFKKQSNLVYATPGNTSPTISVDSSQGFQTIDGFGFCLTGGSATLVNGLSAPAQEDLLKELFLWDSSHIGISYLRISIGASDLSATAFSYDDVPAGQVDPQLDHFTIDKERTDLIPVLKKIIALNPSIKILGSPWSAPAWMKTNGGFSGGSLKPEYYASYASYFVKYIQAMQAEGITIDAITPQNEPLNPNNNPSMVMQAAEERDFIKNNLGPAFAAAGIRTKIITYDHNADRPDYPLTILQDAAAAGFVDGSAFHLYGGPISALSQVHNAFPSKNVYFTEQWVGAPGDFSSNLAWHVENLIIGATRNWSRNVLEWNLASDPNYQPHTDGGCTSCMGALTIGSSVKRNVSYYIIAHASKFVRPGSIRIGSTQSASLPNVAFKNPSGQKVLIVLNKQATPQTFNIQYGSKTVTATLNAGAVATYVW
ncbi:MAG: glycoside hydrolase family 30 protein [Flavisolibacter sp.]